MEKVGILVVSYGAREAAIIDAFSRSTTYDVRIYVVDKQKNPYNMQKATKHTVIPNLDVKQICEFAKQNQHEIDFGIVGPEKPIIEGVRDLVEKETKIPMICPTQQCAIEKSKVEQRHLFDKVVPEANPRFKVFDPKDYRGIADVKKEVSAWLNELRNQVVVKPDTPAAGKGVGVWGDHFNTREQLFEHFLANYQHGKVIIEEKIDGEESSFQAFCDGKHLIPLPETRDYKRAFDSDKGPNTGGMGSYKDVDEWLPFMTKADWEKEITIVNKIFEELKRKNSHGLRGIPFYIAFMHTGKEFKILENNSRPGDPEIQCLLPILKNDFVDVCFKMIEGNLSHVEFEKKATVATYNAPPSYGGFQEAFPDKVRKQEIGTPVNLDEAYKLSERYRDRMRVYPASMELKNSETYALSSRAVCVVGIGDSIQEARNISLKGIKAIKGGALWNRSDIASKEHIQRSIEHLEQLRRRKS